MEEELIAIIPAAGKGTRLKPLTDFIPKELLILGDKPILGHILETLKPVPSIKRACLVVGHKKSTIIDYVKDGSQFDLEVDYVYQSERKGLGHAIYITRNKVPDNKPLFVYLGDTIIYPPQEIIEMIRTYYELKKPFALIMVEEVEDPERYGVVKVEKMNGHLKITDMYEKPTDPSLKKEYMNENGKWLAIAGAYIIRNRIYDYLENTPPGKGGEIQLTDALKNAVKEGERVFAYVLKGTRLDIGTVQSYIEAQKWWINNLLKVMENK
ncbi:MAG: nucleotidyltransferase family protein [Candidatus Nanohaloarchaeota archaeon]|nr:nucleotidyltransferase family protein [Candidatus Nanohaloarchaeota archaeon]